METEKKDEWYEKIWLVTILCVVFFPVGLYALWKNRSIKIGWKIVITAFFAFAVFINLSNDIVANLSNDKSNSTSRNSTKKMDSLSAISLKNDSIKNLQTHQAELKKEKQDSLQFAKWEKTTVTGRIYKRHPEWDTTDCGLIARQRIWIGMTYEMVVYERGKPNTINTSNYGDGNTYQACWEDYDTSCFYFGEDHIITSYN